MQTRRLLLANCTEIFVKQDCSYRPTPFIFIFEARGSFYRAEALS